jgi:hypothetical protein
MLIDGRCYSNIFDLQSDSEADHCLMIADVRKRLSVTKQATQTFGMGQFSLKKPIKLEDKGQYQVTILERVVNSEELR